MIGDLAAFQVCYGILREEKTVQGGQSQLRTASFVTQLFHDESQAMIEVAMAGTYALFRQSAQPGG